MCFTLSKLLEQQDLARATRYKGKENLYWYWLLSECVRKDIVTKPLMLIQC